MLYVLLGLSRSRSRSPPEADSMRAPPHTPKRVTFADGPPDTTDCVVVHYKPHYGGSTDKIHCTFVRSANAWRWQSGAKTGRTRD
eukprot:5848433-Amphidinium_carterae.1